VVYNHGEADGAASRDASFQHALPRLVQGEVRTLFQFPFDPRWIVDRGFAEPHLLLIEFLGAIDIFHINENGVNLADLHGPSFSAIQKSKSGIPVPPSKESRAPGVNRPAWLKGWRVAGFERAP